MRLCIRLTALLLHALARAGTQPTSQSARPWGSVSPATGAVMLREGKTVTLPSELVRKGDCFIEEDKVIVR